MSQMRRSSNFVIAMEKPWISQLWEIDQLQKQGDGGLHQVGGDGVQGGVLQEQLLLAGGSTPGGQWNQNHSSAQWPRAAVYKLSENF